MDLDNLLQKALTITSDLEDYDPSKPPTNGEEYLAHVIHETLQCPEIVTAEIDRQKLHFNQTYNFTDLGGCVSAPAALVPSLEWQQEQIVNFVRMRERVQYLRKIVPVPTVGTTPPIEHESNWKKYVNDDIPRLTSVLFFSQPHLDILLEYHTGWLQELEPGSDLNNYSAWIYSLLLCLETPLLPETCSTLRDIARSCSRLRAQLTPEKQTLEYSKPLSLVICLVARYFNQMDLADN